MPQPRSGDVTRAKRSLVKRLSGQSGFLGAGVAIGKTGAHEIVVLIKEPSSPVVRKVPRQWEGIPVRTQVGGAARKF